MSFFGISIRLQNDFLNLYRFFCEGFLDIVKYPLVNQINVDFIERFTSNIKEGKRNK